MKKWLFTFLVAAFVLPVSAAVLAEDAPGYTDGPLLPNSEWRVHDLARPQPEKVAPQEECLGLPAPEGALVLFDGTNLDAWQRTDGQPIGDGIQDGTFDILKTGQLRTKVDFGDCRLHLEWMSPVEPAHRMVWGNSGLFMMGLFEIQIIESCDSFIYADGNAGAVYGQFPPKVNPAAKPGQWQSFDVWFTAPRFDGETMTAPAYVTLDFNGVRVHDHQEILGPTMHKTLPGAYPVMEKGPIELQNHGSDVKFRNIWVLPLKDGE